MPGYFKDTRQSLKMPSYDVSFTDFGGTTRSAVSRPIDYLMANNESVRKYPGYQDSVYSFRTNRSSGPVKPSHGLFGDVPIIEELREDKPDIPDTGHDFDAVQHKLIHFNLRRSATVPLTRAGDGTTYKGPIGGIFGYEPNFGVQKLGIRGSAGENSLFPDIPDLTPDWGTKAIAKVAPTKSNANIATSLLELRDGLPAIPGRALKHAKGLGDLTKVGPEEFLNIMFGINPSISDIRSVYLAIRDQHKILNQFQRDSDKIVRRRYGFPTRRDSSEWDADIGYGGLYTFPNTPSLFPASQGNASSIVGGGSDWSTHRILTEQDTIWFSGAFRYHLATDSNAWGRIERTGQLVNHLLGSRLDAIALWNAMPWSWLVDWFTDAGDIIANATNRLLDGQMLQYGYVMKKSTHINTFTIKKVVYANGYSIDNLSSSFVTQRKQRQRATPFGFGLNPDSFSDQQWSILGALGYTRAANKLF